MPLDGRGLMRRALSELGDFGYDFLAGIEVEYYIVKVDSDRIVPENAGFTPPPPAVSSMAIPIAATISRAAHTWGLSHHG